MNAGQHNDSGAVSLTAVLFKILGDHVPVLQKTTPVVPNIVSLDEQTRVRKDETNIVEYQLQSATGFFIFYSKLSLTLKSCCSIRLTYWGKIEII